MPKVGFRSPTHVLPGVSDSGTHTNLTQKYLWAHCQRFMSARYNLCPFMNLFMLQCAYATISVNGQQEITYLWPYHNT